MLCIPLNNLVKLGTNLVPDKDFVDSYPKAYFHVTKLISNVLLAIKKGILGSLETYSMGSNSKPHPPSI